MGISIRVGLRYVVFLPHEGHFTCCPSVNSDATSISFPQSPHFMIIVNVQLLLPHSNVFKLLPLALDLSLVVKRNGQNNLVCEGDLFFQ